MRKTRTKAGRWSGNFWSFLAFRVLATLTLPSANGGFQGGNGGVIRTSLPILLGASQSSPRPREKELNHY